MPTTPLPPVAVGDIVLFDNGEGIPSSALVVGLPPAGDLGAYLSITGNPNCREYVSNGGLFLEGTGPNTWSRKP